MDEWLEVIYYGGIAIAAIIFAVSALVAMAAGIIYLLNPHKEGEWE